MDQYPGKQRHYQQSAGWTGSGAKAIKTAVYRLFHYHWFCVSVSSSDDRNSSRCYGNIDDDMMEAALSLGATRMEAFMKVIFPMSLPGIIVGGILVFTGTLTAYTTPQLLGGNSNMVMATLIYQRAMSVSDWTGASVIALIMIVVTLAVIRGFNALAAKLDRRGENYA